MVIEVLAPVAGVAEGVIRQVHLLVAAVAGALQDLEGEVELPGAVGVGGAVFALELVEFEGEPGVGGLTLVGLDIGATAGDPLAQSDRGNVDAVLAGLPDDFLVGRVGLREVAWAATS